LYIDEIEALADEMRVKTAEINSMLESGIYNLVLDQNKSFGPPKSQTAVPHFNFAPIKNAISALELASHRYKSSHSDGQGASEAENILLYTSERELIRTAGLPGRPWFTHHIYAPGFYTGYGVKTIPGVREAIEQRQYNLVAQQIDIAAEVIERMAARVDQLTQ
jgi:N-acetylated-alpha-linked acidic dipeptidase